MKAKNCSQQRRIVQAQYYLIKRYKVAIHNYKEYTGKEKEKGEIKMSGSKSLL